MQILIRDTTWSVAEIKWVWQLYP